MPYKCTRSVCSLSGSNLGPQSYGQRFPPGACSSKSVPGSSWQQRGSVSPADLYSSECEQLVSRRFRQTIWRCVGKITPKIEVTRHIEVEYGGEGGQWAASVTAVASLLCRCCTAVVPLFHYNNLSPPFPLLFLKCNLYRNILPPKVSWLIALILA